MPTAPRHRCTGSSTCPAMLPAGVRYCPAHAVAYEQRRGTRQQRGYGSEHDRRRAAIVDRIRSGTLVFCVTCGVQLAESAFDLGHDEDRRRYLGPQCLPCNRGAGGRRGAAAANRA